MTDRRNHWEGVYERKPDDALSWFRPHLEISLEMIGEVANPKSSIVDVGGGASMLVDDLLEAGYTEVTVLDVAQSSLSVARERLGDRADAVTWIEADVTRADLPAESYDVWHDRAVFHFLTEADDRKEYADLASRAVKPEGYLVIATFAPHGPMKCSGLDVVRYDGLTLGRELGSGFRLEREVIEDHVTPSGETQAFVHCLFKRVTG